jgi:hypothetical protein
MATNARLEADCGEAVERGLPDSEVADRVFDVQGGHDAPRSSSLVVHRGSGEAPRRFLWRADQGNGGMSSADDPVVGPRCSGLNRES